MSRVFPFVSLLTGVVTPLSSALAQNYPGTSIRVVVPAQPGSTCDILSRLIGQKFGERFGQSVIVGTCTCRTKASRSTPPNCRAGGWTR